MYNVPPFQLELEGQVVTGTGTWKIRHLQPTYHGRPPSMDSASDLRCKTCDSTFATKRAFARHRLRHTRVLTCDVCFEYSSVDAESIAYHKRVHHLGTRPFGCTQCNYAGRNAAALRAHQRNIHQDERPFACPVCSFTTKTSWYLKQHAARHVQVGAPREG